jgi:hypothetical protein
MEGSEAKSSKLASAVADLVSSQTWEKFAQLQVYHDGLACRNTMNTCLTWYSTVYREE